MLAAGAGSAERIDAAIAFIDVNVDLVIDNRINPDRRE